MLLAEFRAANLSSNFCSCVFSQIKPSTYKLTQKKKIKSRPILIIYKKKNARYRFQPLKCSYLLLFYVLYHCKLNILWLVNKKLKRPTLTLKSYELYKSLYKSFWSCNIHKHFCENLGGADCGNLIPSAVCLLRLGWVEGNKELLNKSFSVREEAVIRRAGTAARELLLTFTSGRGQHGPPLPTTQPLNASWIGVEDGEMKKTSHKRILHSTCSRSHKYFPMRVESHLSCNLKQKCFSDCCWSVMKHARLL